MKNLINKIANDRKLSSAVAFIGMALGTACHIIALSAVFYNGMRKGVDKVEDYYYQQELERYNNGR